MAAGVGADQYLPDTMEDQTLGFHQSPGGDVENQMNGHSQQQYQQKGGNGVIMQDSNELNETQKLQLAERANEIYRQQLKYMQDHLASLRSLIQDKENIIENLMLRYDLGIITQDQNRQGGNLSPDEIEMEELRRKAEALAQRTILENFELREMVNELRDENFHLRNEIYELQDKINRQVLQINKLEKSAQSQPAQNTMAMPDMFGDDDGDDNDIYDDVEEDEIEDAPIQNARLTGRRESRTMDHPANSDEARQKRMERKGNHERKESVKPPDLFGDQDSDPEDYMDDEAMRKRQERANKTRKESIATPDIYGDDQGESEEDEEDESDIDDDNKQSQQTGTKRRGSQIYMDEEAIRKRAERQRKAHRRDSSIAAPPIFRENYDPEKVARDKAKKDAPEAIQKRLTRRAKKVGAAAVKYVKSHRRKESLAEKLLLGPTDFDMDNDLDLKAADPEKRKELQAKARKEQRRKSRQLIKSQVGDKSHYSDDDIQEDKPQRAALKARKKMKTAQRANAQQEVEEYEMNTMPVQPSNKKRGSIKAEPIIITGDEEKNPTKHRRDSTVPVPNLGFEDPDVLLHYEKLKVEDLQTELDKRGNQLADIRKQRDQLRDQIQIKTQTANQLTTTNNKIENEMVQAIESKAKLAQKCAMEIMRLTMILNALQNMPQFKEIVQLLIDESTKESNKNGGSLLG